MIDYIASILGLSRFQNPALRNQVVPQTITGHHGVTWLLTNIEDDLITSAPTLMAHGDIENWQGGLKLDGKSSWIEVNTTEGE